MAEDDNVPKVDRRGTTIFVPLALVVVFAIIVVLMIWPKGDQAPPEGPTTGSGAARPGAVK
jgi:hypothetical protein